ncbi:D-ribose pyranase [Microaerobacter geothermalis]|uniref:D-ribose pyranase n=1 Tax=Microaerobacter geothermalis TaxID=674972 RepID=UPI001F4302F2|nr:D-ribose pyranase [Microaerobacter geothermalis]MCF6093788.1 D-ribose pyranase [Microaerobacter geothermalis]
MKKQGILQHEISEVIAKLGHGDMIVIADAGLPIPQGVRRIDLALSKGIPSFLDTLKAILDDVEVESCIIAEELPEVSPELYKKMEKVLKVPVSQTPHEEFKKITETSVAVIRTGEFTPYANIILKAGVVF